MLGLGHWDIQHSVVVVSSSWDSTKHNYVQKRQSNLLPQHKKKKKNRNIKERLFLKEYPLSHGSQDPANSNDWQLHKVQTLICSSSKPTILLIHLAVCSQLKLYLWCTFKLSFLPTAFLPYSPNQMASCTLTTDQRSRNFYSIILQSPGPCPCSCINCRKNNSWTDTASPKSIFRENTGFKSIKWAYKQDKTD